MYLKLNDFVSNDTDCNYISVTLKDNFKEVIEELENLFNKCKCEVEIPVEFNSFYIQQDNEFDSSNFYDDAFIGFDGYKYYVQFYFNPVIDNQVIDELHCVIVNFPINSINKIKNAVNLSYKELIVQ